MAFMLCVGISLEHKKTRAINDLDTPQTHDAALMVCCKDAGEGLCSELGTIRSRIKPQATFSFAGDSNKSNVSLTFFELAWHTAFAVNQQEHVLR